MPAIRVSFTAAEAAALIRASAAYRDTRAADPDLADLEDAELKLRRGQRKAIADQLAADPTPAPAPRARRPLRPATDTPARRVQLT